MWLAFHLQTTFFISLLPLNLPPMPSSYSLRYTSQLNPPSAASLRNPMFHLGWPQEDDSSLFLSPMPSDSLARLPSDPLARSPPDSLTLGRPSSLQSHRDPRPLRYDSSSDSLALACRDVFDSLYCLSRSGALSTGPSTAATTPSILRVHSSAHFDIPAQETVAVIMVGLPACGKSTMCRQLCAHITNLLDKVSKIYNAGDIRRRATKSRSESYFDPGNSRARRDRERYADTAVAEAIHDLNSGKAHVAFVDATNTTAARRDRLVSAVRDRARPGTCIIMMEVQCDDARLLRFNISGKAHNRDYCETRYSDAIQDFSARVEHYKAAYEPVTPREIASYPLSAYVVAQNGGMHFDFTVCDASTLASSVYHMIRKFASDYMRRDGQRYLEAVDAFYRSGGA